MVPIPLLWTHRTIEAGADAAWAVFTDLDAWPVWGPSVRGARLDPPGGFVAGATGVVDTAVGVSLPFELTAVDPGRRWSLRVAGIPATTHTVEALGGDRCRVGFGVPAPVAPYLVVCRIALARIERLALEV